MTAMLRYDMLRAPFSPLDDGDLYRICLEQCAWADERGFDGVFVSEHHGVEGGFLPSPIVMASAIAARTKKLGVSISALLVPLYDPIRLAEDIAVLDLISGGRVSIVTGLGYRREEFEMLGVDRSRRGTACEEAIGVLRKAWTGEPFEYRGTAVQVTPRPLQSPHPGIVYGGASDAAARRAARLGLPFMPVRDDDPGSLADLYYQEARAQGFESAFAVLFDGPGTVFVSDDPDATWQEIGPYALHYTQTHTSWQCDGIQVGGASDAQTVAELRASGIYAVLTPDDCVKLLGSLGEGAAALFHPLLGGLPPDVGWSSLELFVEKVLPQVVPLAAST